MDSLLQSSKSRQNAATNGSNTMTVSFKKNEEGIRNMAIYVAQLVKEAVGFVIRQDSVGYEVELTGGF